MIAEDVDSDEDSVDDNLKDITARMPLRNIGRVNM
jgi:hypothetical protein